MRLQPRMCSTCPFRKGSKHGDLIPILTLSAKYEGTRECHQTGTNAIGGETGRVAMACAGARRVALNHWSDTGFIEAPTEEAWKKKCDELGIKNGILAPCKS